MNLKSTVVPSVSGIIISCSLGIAFVVRYLIAQIQGINEAKTLQTQCTRKLEQQASTTEERLDNLTSDLRAQCDEDKQFILNNMRGGS